MLICLKTEKSGLIMAVECMGYQCRFFTDFTVLFKISSLFKCNRRKSWFGDLVCVDLIGIKKIKYSKGVQKNW